MARKADINIKIGADLKDFSTSMQNAARQMKRMGRKMTKLGKSLSRSVTLPLLAIGAASIKFASDLEEAVSKSDVVFKEASQDVKDFAKTTLDSFGIAEASALEMAATFGAMGTSMGIARKDAGEMSKTLTGLAGDLASFNNIRIAEATTALNAVFTGETESLKRLGIVMTQTNLKAFALSKGLDGNIMAMSEAEKVNLRYSFVLSKTSDAQGDFERTGGGAAGQMRVFQETLKELAASFGEVILPTFTKLTSKVNGFLKVVRNLSPQFKKIIVIIAAVAAALGPLIFAVGALTTALAFLAANPIVLIITGVIVAIAALAAGIIFVVQNWDKLVEKVNIGGAVIKNKLLDIAKFMTNTLLKTFEPLTKLLGIDLVGVSSAFFDSMKSEVPEATEEWKSLSNIIGEVKDKLKGATETPIIDIKPTGGKAKKKTRDKSDISQTGIFFSIRQFRKDTEAALEPLGKFQDAIEGFPEENSMTRFFENLADTVIVTSQQISDAIGFLVQDTFTGLGIAIGQALASAETTFDDFGNKILVSIAGFLGSLGQMLIAAGTAKIAFDQLALSGVGAIAAGIALVALSTAVQAKLKESSQAFAMGGIVQGESGRDKVPIMATAGELILNRAQQNNIANQLNGNMMILSTRLMGNDILISGERTGRNKGRIR